MKLQTSGVLGTSYAIAKLAPKRGSTSSQLMRVKGFFLFSLLILFKLIMKCFSFIMVANVFV